MSDQVDNIDDDSGEVKAKVPTPKAKDRESRASVRKELRYQRQHLKDLRSRLKNGENLSEGMVYIGKKRVRAEYFLPTKILIMMFFTSITTIMN